MLNLENAMDETGTFLGSTAFFRIKQQADEDMVTYLRVKLAESDNKVVKGEGKDMLTRRN